MTTEISPLKKLTHDWFENVWNKNDVNSVHRLMCSSCVFHDLVSKVPGPAGFIPFFQVYQNAFDNLKIDIEEIIEEGEICMGHATFSAFHNKTKKNVKFDFSFFAKWNNSKLVEAKNIIDTPALLTQLGIQNLDQMHEIFATPEED